MLPLTDYIQQILDNVSDPIIPINHRNLCSSTFMTKVRIDGCESWMLSMHLVISWKFPPESIISTHQLHSSR